MSLGLHHHKHNKSTESLLYKVIDQLVYIGGVLGPILTIPQIVKIYSNHTAAGVSAFSWFAYAIAAIFWFAYGIIHKDKAIIVSYFLWIIFDFAVAIGALVYA